MEVHYHTNNFGNSLDGLKYCWIYLPLGYLSFYFAQSPFSTQAAYAAPIIMMAQNRQNERDRLQAQADYQTNIDAKLEIEALAIKLNSLEVDKLDKIINMLNEMKTVK